MSAFEYRRDDGVVLWGEVHVPPAAGGAPVLFVHGLSCDRTLWDPVRAALPRDRLHIAIDLRGHGLSDTGGPGYQAHHYAADLPGMLAAAFAAAGADPEPVHLAGFSLGGAVTLRFALDHPELARSLGHIDGAIEGWKWSEEWRAMFRKIARAIVEGGYAGGIREAWTEAPLFERARRRHDIAVRMRRMSERARPEVFLDPAPADRENPSFARAHTLTVPLLLLTGEHDLPDFHAGAAALAERVPGAERHIIAGSHMTPLEHPELVAGHLTGFWERVEGVRA